MLCLLWAESAPACAACLGAAWFLGGRTDVSVALTHRAAQDADWRARESGILALGAISDGCANGLLPFLEGMLAMLLPRLQDQRPLVRSITCWALSRYSRWLGQQTGQPGAGHAQVDAVLQVSPSTLLPCCACSGSGCCACPGKAVSCAVSHLQRSPAEHESCCAGVLHVLAAAQSQQLAATRRRTPHDDNGVLVRRASCAAWWTTTSTCRRLPAARWPRWRSKPARSWTPGSRWPWWRSLGTTGCTGCWLGPALPLAVLRLATMHAAACP